MNLFDSSFLCLDIGSAGVRGIAHRIKSGRIDKSAMHTVDNYDTVFALKSVIDELEQQIGAHFDTAYITGNFGTPHFEMAVKNTVWNGEHKISASDIKSQISQITAPCDCYPMHIIPLRYDTPTARNILNPIGHIDRQLISVISAIFFPRDRMDTVMSYLRRAHIQATAFYAPQYLQNSAFRTKKQTTMFIDVGAQLTTVSIWTDRGPVWYGALECGGTNITNAISEQLNIDFDSAERIKRAVSSLMPHEMDRFTPADTAYDFSRADVNDIVLPIMVDIAAGIKEIAATPLSKYRPTKIILTGGGTGIENISGFFENAFGLPTENMHSDATVRALSQYVWDAQSDRRNAHMARRAWFENRASRIGRLFGRRPKKTKNRFIPIMPSTLCFDMKSDATYSMFKSAGISMIHVDIMDGFYVDRIAGSINSLKYIRAHTDAHLHVHLMTESPTVWAADAIAAGANTIILSTNTSGVRAAIRAIKTAGRRAGVALNPESSVTILKPILREIDEVMIMAVPPGAAGQPFNTDVLQKIRTLAATRQKYNLKYKISVDGGIDADTAQLCWDAGADLLVSGSYLARNNDFPLAVHSLLPHYNE